MFLSSSFSPSCHLEWSCDCGSWNKPLGSGGMLAGWNRALNVTGQEGRGNLGSRWPWGLHTGHSWPSTWISLTCRRNTVFCINWSVFFSNIHLNPITIRQAWRQRQRWQRGKVEKPSLKPSLVIRGFKHSLLQKGLTMLNSRALQSFEYLSQGTMLI